MTWDGHSYEFHIQMETSGRIDCGIFSDGLRSDDPGKADWLTKMNQLSSSAPAIAPGIRIWLQQYCELIEFRGPAAE
jgi:hypothetical protein